MFDINVRDDDGSGKDSKRFEGIRNRLSAAWSRTKAIVRAWWPVLLTALLVGFYVGDLIAGRDATKLEKLSWLGLPAGAILCAPIVALYLHWFHNPTRYWYEKNRGDDSDNPAETWKLNEQAHQKMTSRRHAPEREKGTLNPTFRVIDIDTETWTVEPGYRGRMDADDLRRDRTNYGKLWDAVQEDGLRADMWRDYLSPIVRKMERQRAKNRNAVLEGHTMPGNDTVDDAIRDVVDPEDLPPSLRRGDGDDDETDVVDDLADKLPGDVDADEIMETRPEAADD
jgi:hypothetical protein